MNKIRVLVVNINNLNYTKNCINDLLNQTNNDFNITLIDQGSIEEGTSDYLDSLSDNDNITIIRNGYNVSLNKLWNDFAIENNEEYLCYLNNDVRLTNNFIQDTIDIFEKEDKTGIVIHSTNSFKYNHKIDELDYVIYDKKIKQGWDFTIRRNIYEKIPSDLKFYFGDDWLFHNCYEKGYNVAICLSSPIIHYAEKSAKYSPINFKDEEVFFNKIGLTRYLPHYNDYNEILPTFKNFNDNSIKTIIYLGLSYNEINNTYTDNDKVKLLNNKILFDLKNYNKITQLTKDNIKISISKLINDTINNGYDTLCIYSDNLLYTLKYIINHLPNIKIMSSIEYNDDLIDKISTKYNINNEKSIEYIKNYNDNIIKLLSNIEFSS